MRQGRDVVFDRVNLTKKEASVVDKIEFVLNRAVETNPLCGEDNWKIIFKTYVFLGKKGKRSVVLSVGWKTTIDGEKYGSYFFIKNPEVNAAQANSLIKMAKEHSEQTISKIGTSAGPA